MSVRFVRGFVFFFVCFSQISFAAKNNPATFCGFQIANHDSRYVVGRLATAAFESPEWGYLFPTVATLSTRPQFANQRNENHFLNVFDGVVRTGAARFANGTAQYMNHDWSSIHGVSDVSVIGCQLETTGMMSRGPLTAVVDDSGTITLFVSEKTRLGERIAAQGVGSFKVIPEHSGHLNFDLPSLPKEKFRSIDLLEISPGFVRVFALTETAIYSLDLYLNHPKFLSTLPEWKLVANRPAGEFVRALSDSSVVVADETGKIEMISQGRSTSLGYIPGGFLTSLSVYRLGRADVRLAALSYTQTANPVPSIHLWSGGRFELLDIAFSEGEMPIALAYTGMRPESMLEWSEWRRREQYTSGYLTEAVENELKRLLVLTREGTDYKVRGVQGMSQGKARLSTFPWFYVGPGYDRLERAFAQAGFDVNALRQVINVETDIGQSGSKMAWRLSHDHKFPLFNSDKPNEYRGDPYEIVGAWIRRLESMRDLRLTRSRIATAIGEEGITLRRDQLLVYELMGMEELERGQLAEFNFDKPVPLPPTDEEWFDDFQFRLSDHTSGLIQSTAFHHGELTKYYRAHLETKDWAEVNDMDYDQISSDAAKALYLVSQHYLKKPFKAVVEDFLNFCVLSGEMAPSGKTVEPWDSNGERLWETLADYLDSIDPLRKVTNEQTLVQFLTRRLPQ